MAMLDLEFTMDTHRPETAYEQREDIKDIKEYLYELTEQLQYVLNNLEEENLSENLRKLIREGKAGGN